VSHRYAGGERGVLEWVMSTTQLVRTAARSAHQLRIRLVDDLERLRSDAGVSMAELSRAADIPAPYLSRILSGKAHPTLETYARLGAALGADLSARYYPNTGPAIRDRHQARISEALLAIVAPRWRPYLEVAVRRPSRGFIDVALHEPRERVIVATEIESELRRLEQQIRWSRDKAEALPSWMGWPHLGDAPDVSQLLIVRSTRATREIGREFERVLRAAYPAHPDDALAALTGTARWPGPALIWARFDGRETRFLGVR
jgi:transcriptional regulator with XRE-family HTH domain